MPHRPHRRRALSVLILLLGLLVPGVAQAADTIVVGLRPGALAATALDAADAVQVGAVPRLRVVVVHVAPAHGSAALRALRRSRAVRYAEPLRRLQALADVVPDPGRAQQWGLDAIGADAEIGRASCRERV